MLACTLLSARCQRKGTIPAPRSASMLPLHCLEEQPPPLLPLRCTTWHPMPPPAGSDASSSHLDSILCHAQISSLPLSQPIHRVPPPPSAPRTHVAPSLWSTPVTNERTCIPSIVLRGRRRDNALCGLPLAHRGVRGLYASRALPCAPLPRPQVGMLATHVSWPSSPTHLSSRADATSYGH
jgi:hypothetical protein